MQQNYLKIFFPQKAGTSRNNIEKELEKPSPKLRKYVY